MRPTDENASAVVAPARSKQCGDEQRWRNARDHALAAYRYWDEASPDGRGEAYAVYRAAEEQEEAAAHGLRLSVQTA